MVIAQATPSLHALSIDAELSDGLRLEGSTARVHSVFEHVINVITPTQRLIALCGRQHDDRPWSLRANVDDWLAWTIEVGAVLHVDREAVRFADHGPQVDLRRAQVWKPLTTAMTATTAQLSDRACLLSDLIRSTGVPGGALLGPAHDPFAAAVSDRIRRGLADIAGGELAGHSAGIEVAASSLIGLGPGLTPAGDDVLTGLALVVARPGSHTTTVLPALRTTLKLHLHRTTAVSGATLSAALGGRAPQRLLDLIDLLVSSDDAGIPLLRRRAEHVADIGHTSGTDLLSGVLAGIELEIQRRGSA